VFGRNFKGIKSFRTKVLDTLGFQVLFISNILTSGRSFIRFKVLQQYNCYIRKLEDTFGRTAGGGSWHCCFVRVSEHCAVL